MSERLHDREGYQCAAEECGGTRLDPCNYTRDEARGWRRSVYIIGGAGSGKSTFTSDLLDATGCQMGPLRELHQKPNRKATVTLRGHGMIGEFGEGLYLGVMRDEFPGSDGLDRASSPVGAEWLEKTIGQEPPVIIGEGATLATRPFLTALHENTDLLLVHLYVDPVIADIRFLQRGSAQPESFVKNTVTRSHNLLLAMNKLGVKCWEVDSGDRAEWAQALQICQDHLRRG